MKKTLLLVLLSFAVFSSLIAQTRQWLQGVKAGGSSGDKGTAITLDSSGNRYVTGSFYGTATFGAHTLVSSGGSDIFVACLNPQGNWVWATRAGGANGDLGTGIACAGDGCIYVTGNIRDNVSFGSITVNGSASSNIFVAKMDTLGNWIWAVGAGGNGTDYAYGITADAGTSVYLTGVFSETATFGATSLVSAGGLDIWTAKLDTDGNWVWIKQAGGSLNDEGMAITIDSAGDIACAGHFRGLATFGPTQLQSLGGADVFVSKLSPLGSWTMSIRAGGANDDYCQSICSDQDANLLITGYFYGTAVYGDHTITLYEAPDIQICKLSPAGTWLWAKRAGSYNYDAGFSIRTDDQNNVYVTGSFSDECAFGTWYTSSSGSQDIFAVSLDPSGNWLWYKTAGGAYEDKVMGMTIQGDLLMLTGSFVTRLTFGPNILNSSGGTDIYAAILNYNYIPPPYNPPIVSPTQNATNVAVDAPLVWTPNASGSTPEGYKLWLGTDNPPTNMINGIDLGNVTSYTNPEPLDWGTQYYWKVAAYNASGSSSPGVYQFQTTYQPPLPVSVFYPGDGSETIPINSSLTWEEPVGGGTPGTYRLYLGSNNPPSNLVNGTLLGNVLSYTPASPFTNDTLYYWQLIPYNHGVAPQNCPIWSFRTIPLPPGSTHSPNPYSGQTSVPLNKVLTWQIPTGSTLQGIRLWLGTDNPPGNILDGVDIGVVTSYTHPHLFDSYTRYYWKAQPYNAGGVASNQPVWNFRTVVAPPGPVSQFSPTDAQTGVSLSPSLTWSPPSQGGEPTGYKLYLGTDNPPSNLVNGSSIGNVLTYTPSQALQNSTWYYWKLVPFNSTGEASGCPIWSFQTMEAPPLPAILISPPNLARNVLPDATLNWLPNPDGSTPTGYKLHLSVDDFTPNIVNWDDMQATSFQNESTYDHSRWYFWKVVPFNSSGDAQDCPVWSFRVVPQTPLPAVNPYPPDLAVNITPAVTLSWESSEWGWSSYEYVLWLGTDNPPSNLVNGLVLGGAQSYQPSTSLQYGLQYYWKILPTNEGLTPENCPVWSFTTCLEDLPTSLLVDSEPQGAHVFIDGDEFGVTPYETSINPGQTLSVSVGMVGWIFLPEIQSVTYSYLPQTLMFTGMEIPPPEPQIVMVYSDPPGADVYLDGSFYGPSPACLTIWPDQTMNINLSLSGWVFMPEQQWVAYMPNPQEFWFYGTQHLCTVYVDTSPSAASVVVNGLDIGNSPCSFQLAYGEVACVEVYMPEFIFNPSNMQVSYQEEDQYLSFIGVHPPLEPQIVHVTTEPPGASIWMGSDLLGYSPCEFWIGPEQSCIITASMDLWVFSPQTIEVTWSEEPIPVYFGGYQIESPVSVQSEPMGSNVWIDDVFRGTTPYDFFIERDSMRVVRVSQPNYEFWPDSLEVCFDPQPQTIWFHGNELPPPPEPMQVYVTSCPDGVEIRLNGVFLGLTPISFSVPVDSTVVVNTYERGWEFIENDLIIYWGVLPTQLNFCGMMIPCVVSFSSDPSEANLLINGMFVANTPCQIELFIDTEWQVQAERPGWMYHPDPVILNWSEEQQSVHFDGAFLYDGTWIDPASIPLEWLLEFSPYVITDPLWIDPDQTIEVEDGVEVQVACDDYLRIQGTFQGSEVDFVPTEDNPNWGGVILESQNDGRNPSQFSNCRIIDAREPMTIKSGSPVISNLIIEPADSLSSFQGVGLIIKASASPHIQGLEINNYRVGLRVERDSTSSNGCPILQNIRISQPAVPVPVDSLRAGIELIGAVDLQIQDAEIDSFDQGIVVINHDYNGTSTPTLSNIRVRNSSNSSRMPDTGISVTGKVNLFLNDADIIGFGAGIDYHGSLLETATSTPTLSNIRVRNSSSTSRTAGTGIHVQGLNSILLHSNSVLGYATGIEVGPGIAAEVFNCHVKYATEGLIYGSQVAAELASNSFEDCVTAIQVTSEANLTRIVRNMFFLDPSLPAEHPELSYTAIDCQAPLSLSIRNNSLLNYPIALSGSSGNIDFVNNIIWAQQPLDQPFMFSGPSLQVRYCDIYYTPGIYPGVGNINADPLFVAPELSLYLNPESPCIDTGDPDYTDFDGTRSDMGAEPYIHWAEFHCPTSSSIVGENISFTNGSPGHNRPYSQFLWDLGNDGVIDGSGQQFCHVFTQPGIYDMKLITMTGALVDSVVVQAVILITAEAYEAPGHVIITPSPTGLLLNWEPVSENIWGGALNAPVTHYLIFHSSTPYGEYEVFEITSGRNTSLQLPDDGSHFYRVMAFSGDQHSLDELRHRKLRFPKPGDR